MSQLWDERLSRRAVVAGVAAAALAGCAHETVPAGSPSAVATPIPTPSSGPPSASASPSAATSTPSSAAHTATVVMSGDLLWHNTLWFSAADDHRRTGKGDEFDFDPMFAQIKPIISGADLAIAHVEVPFAPAGGPYTGYPDFAAPPQIAPWMATMGWTMATTESNHSIDKGFAGLVRTRELLTRNGIMVEGTYATHQQRNTPVIKDVNGIKVAVIGGTYDLNGLTPPADKTWCVSMWDLPNLKAQAARAKKAGADFVMAHLHGGEEYQTAPNQDQIDRATALTADPNVDLVFGEHVHVVQPITKLNGKWVIYGMGNMVAQHKTDVIRGYDGITIRLTLVAGDDGKVDVARVEYLPTLVTHYSGPAAPVRLYPVVAGIRDGIGPKAELQASLQRTRAAVKALGAVPGLIES